MFRRIEAGLTMRTFMNRPRSRNRLARFTLRSFLVFFTLVAIWIGWIAVTAREQRRVLRIVKESGGSVAYKYQEDIFTPAPPIRTWLGSKLGDEFVFSIAGVYLEGEKVDDDVARRLGPHLEQLRDLKWLEFRGTKITNASMQHISQLRSLERLFVRPSQESGRFYKPPVPIRVTVAGLNAISNLENLKVLSLNYGRLTGPGFANASKLSKVEELDLRGTDVDDSALKYLKDLRQLRQLNLWETHISDAGLVHLMALPNLENLYLSRTAISDQGLRLLTNVKGLRILDVAYTDVTDFGLVKLSNLKSLHELRLTGTVVSDEGLAHLTNLKTLRILELGDTKITDAGVARLESMKQLQELSITNNERVTSAAVLRLQTLLPRCKVE